MEQILLGNRYKLYEEIGSGGMAHVFKARDILLDRTVAIKILKPEFTGDTQFIERFRVEAKAAASLSNANIVMIYDVGQDDGLYYIIMEYVDGITLKDYIANVGQIPWKETVTLALQMTEAIAGAHANQIIHRDIKPQNILITRDRRIKITDFGIARAASNGTTTTVGNAMGSVHYFSPEQAKGVFADEKSDIYSLGITLYEMATGAAPFDGETPISVALKHIQEPPEPPTQRNPQIPEGLGAVILKAIAKDKFERYQSMNEMSADLRQVYTDPSGASLIYAAVYGAGGQAYGGGVPGGAAYAGNENAYVQDVRYEPVDGYDEGYEGGAEYGDDDRLASGHYGDGYDGEYDGGFADNGYNGGAGAAGDEMSNRNRQTVGGRRTAGGRGYSGRSGPAPRRGGTGRNGRNSGRSANINGDGRHSGVFVGIALVASLAAIVFVIWLMREVFGLVQPPISENRDADSFSVGNYIGRKYEEVSEELQGEGVTVRESRVTNDIIPEGTITDQSPEAGIILQRNSADAITLEVSDGVRRFNVPDYLDRGAESREAEAELRAHGLTVSVSDEQSGSVPKGYVVRTEPGVGAQLEPGSKITIYRSSGSGVTQTSVPQLLGRTYGDAVRLLADALLTLGAVSPAEPGASAVVIRQSYAANTVVDEGVAVDLWFEDAESTTTAATTEPATTPEPTPTPEATPTPTPTPDGAALTPTPDPNASEGTDSQTTEPGGEGGEQTTTGDVIDAEPVEKTVRLTLPEDREYGEMVKVLVEATPSGNGRVDRVLNRSVSRDGFPRDITFTIPASGSVELKVYYDGELMQTKVYNWADEVE